MSYQKAEEALQEADIRITRIRREILAVLYELGHPVSHGDISSQEQLRNFDRVTLYRSLNLLLEKGLVHGVLGTDGSWRYCAHPKDVEGCPGGHPHFLCMECGRMFCLPDQAIPFVEVPPDFEVAGKQFVIYGRCSECRNKVKDTEK